MQHTTRHDAISPPLVLNSGTGDIQIAPSQKGIYQAGKMCTHTWDPSTEHDGVLHDKYLAASLGTDQQMRCYASSPLALLSEN